MDLTSSVDPERPFDALARPISLAAYNALLALLLAAGPESSFLTLDSLQRAGRAAEASVRENEWKLTADVMSATFRPDGWRRRARLLAVLILIEQLAHGAPTYPLSDQG
jgi:hypothetical protein